MLPVSGLPFHEKALPREGIRRPDFHIHSCVCEQFIYRSAFSAAGKYVDRSWEYINHSQTMNVEIGTEAAQFQGNGIQKWDFSCSAQKQKKCLGKEKVGAGKR